MVEIYCFLARVVLTPAEVIHSVIRDFVVVVLDRLFYLRLEPPLLCSPRLQTRKKVRGSDSSSHYLRAALCSCPSSVRKKRSCNLAC